MWVTEEVPLGPRKGGSPRNREALPMDKGQRQPTGLQQRTHSKRRGRSSRSSSLVGSLREGTTQLALSEHSTFACSGETEKESQAEGRGT
ncbi:hypothetical protein NDU88_003351 [Pleurodeles waltl]|uniref:Uncharacterized protein n=1 Tax=Pleurodeles waltl TaxID=8319 RepID=A0AAV7UDT0_PLEWA|nr:hypothetical protein NDU88_003351 [Pleurodeles waltl]